jgi:hypothetical protein
LAARPARLGVDRARRPPSSRTRPGQRIVHPETFPGRWRGPIADGSRCRWERADGGRSRISVGHDPLSPRTGEHWPHGRSRFGGTRSRTPRKASAADSSPASGIQAATRGSVSEGPARPRRRRCLRAQRPGAIPRGRSGQGGRPGKARRRCSTHCFTSSRQPATAIPSHGAQARAGRPRPDSRLGTGRRSRRQRRGSEQQRSQSVRSGCVAGGQALALHTGAPRR